MQLDTARQCIKHIADGSLTSVELVKHHAALIQKTDAAIGAWQHFDAKRVEQTASVLDEMRRRSDPLGSLHGIPVGLKDIFDTADYPTEYGSAIHQGRKPTADCRVVEKLKEAGALVMGKTVTTEFAFMHPSSTTNPHSALHSPGGSSSGSAASVAAGQVPLAIGSQTNGSVIRPASFCGVYGFKPSSGIVSRAGVLETSQTLDTVGFFGRDLADVALLADALAGYDNRDKASYLAPKPKMLEGYLSDVPVPPSYAWIDMPYTDRYSEDVVAGFEELLSEMGESVERIPAPQSFAALIPCHKIIHEYEIVRCLQDEIDNGWASISDTIKPTLENAKSYTDDQYHEALEIRQAAMQWFASFFNDYDAILTPSAVSEAPLVTAGGTGDPVCCTIWTLCGLPCINLPLLSGANDLPIGVQLVGAYRQDDRLMRTARHMLESLQPTREEQTT